MGELFVAYEYWFAAAQLSLAMLGMGATLRLPDFGEVLREPRGIAVGLATQLALVPILALAITTVLPLQPGIAVGIVLVAAVPGGTISNVLTFLARGNAPLSISLTAVSTLACLATTPVVMELLAGRHVPDFAMPVARVSREILFTLLGPLALGMALGAWRERWRGPIARWGIRGSLFVIALMVAGGAAAGRIEPLAYGWLAPLAVIALAAGGLGAGMGLGRAVRLPRRDRIAIGIEAGVRNTNLALLIKASVFPAASAGPDPIGDGAFFVALLYGGVALPVAAGPLLLHRRLGARAAAPAAGAAPGAPP